QSRDQRTVQILTADPATGRTELVREVGDPAWVELVPGSPAWSGSSLVTVEDVHDLGADGTRALLVDGDVVSPPGVQVRSIVRADAGSVTVTASADDPTQVHVWRWEPASGCRSLTGEEEGVHAAVAAGAVRVVTTSSLASPTPRVRVTWSTGD